MLMHDHPLIGTVTLHRCSILYLHVLCGSNRSAAFHSQIFVYVLNTILATVLYQIYNVEPKARHFLSDTIRERISYCAYEMKSTLSFAPRREFARDEMIREC